MDRVSSEEVISDDVPSVSELVVVLGSEELGEDSCNVSSCTGTYLLYILPVWCFVVG